MANERVARDFFTAHLPEEVRQLTDLKNLILQPRSHINDIRRESTVDILYKTTIDGQKAYLYLLLEHQSTPDKLMPFRLLKYTCNIMDQHLKDPQNTLLPLVYPMVIYHAEHAYPYSTDIKDIVNAPRGLVQQYFLKPFHLIDLGQCKDEELRQHAWAGAMEFALKHIFARDFLPYLQNIAQLLREIDQSGGREYISVMLQYVLERGDLKDKPAFFELINQKISPEIGDEVMTLAERIRIEGKLEGIAEGELKGKAEVAQSLLASGAELAFIAKITGLSLDQLRELQAGH
jgi:predicted transposase/invertase (TIGR01784 family)